MRHVPLLAVALFLCGCGLSVASNNATPTPQPSPTPFGLSAARFHAYPPMTITARHRYFAAVTTNDGTFTIQLLPAVAPRAVNSFVFLARHRYYDNVIVHRIVPDEFFQTGDPTGTGYGGPGYQFQDEKVTMPYTLGTVAMAHTSAPSSNGSQFFVVTGRRLALAPSYTIFGKVVSGINVVEKIGRTPVGTDPATGELAHPLVTVTVMTIRIRETA